MTSSGVLSLVRMSNLVCALTFRICRSSSRSSAPEVFSPVMTRSKCLALTVANASQLLSARSTSQVGSMDATCVAISGSGPTTRAVRRGVDGGSETSNDIELADSTGPPLSPIWDRSSQSVLRRKGIGASFAARLPESTVVDSDFFAAVLRESIRSG